MPRTDTPDATPAPVHVLVVDDDPAIRTGLAELLTGAGYHVDTAGALREAMHIIRTTPPDLLITDIRLGEFNGLQLVVSSPHPIPAIVMTGFDDPLLESDTRRSGAAYLRKPVDAHQLLELVRQLSASD